MTSGPEDVESTRPHGVELIERERQRQMAVEKWTPEHDDEHVRGELLDAGLSYVLSAINVGHPAMLTPPSEWPWDEVSWKPSGDVVCDLVKAGALIAAEIDRLQRRAEMQAGMRMGADAEEPDPESPAGEGSAGSVQG